jgi:hypothetical protein
MKYPVNEVIFIETGFMKKYTFSFIGMLILSNSIFSQPPNDDPCGAIPLTVQTGTKCRPTNPFSWTNATASAGIPAPGCGSYFTGDIWYSFVCPASGNVNITTLAGTGPGAITDGAMTVYGTSSGCSGSFFYIVCNDDSIPGVLMPYLSLNGLTIGAVYFIRFWDYNDAVSGNIGGICVTDPNPPLATSGAVGIGIQNPDLLLDVNGPVRLRAGNPGLNKVLSSDINGVATWKKLVDPIPFKLSNSFDQVIPSGTINNMNFDFSDYDAGGVSGGVFVAPETGIYHFDAQVLWVLSSVSSTDYFELYLQVSGATAHLSENQVHAGTTSFSQNISADVSLTAFQTVRIAVRQTTGINQTIYGNSPTRYSYFDGHRIK